MSDPNCIFCKIVNKEIPAEFVYEDDFVIAFPDIHPLTPGHTLLIPKEHYPWFYDVPREVANELFAAAQEIARKLKAEHSADYIELKIIGIDIPHTHIHLIPRS
ncbi:MAG: HIT domain-containing protein [bacterium]|nr:HIT domain-containing protein [bacterium]